MLSWSASHLNASDAINAILILTGASKLLNLEWFMGVIHQLTLVRQAVARIISCGVISLEIIIGSVLLFDFWMPWPAFAAVCLVTIFTCLILKSLLTGKTDVECGCFGLWKRKRIGMGLVLRNLAFIGLILFSVFVDATAWSPLSSSMLAALTMLSILPSLA